MYNSDILMPIRIAQICCQFFSYLNYYLIITNIVQTLLILSGNVLENPGPTDCNLKFFHWNLDSLAARDNSKISLIEAYKSVFNYDLISISDTRLDRSVSNEDTQIKGFSCDILRSHHPSDTRNPGGVCLYYKENIPIKRRNDLEIHDETVVAEISLRRKKVFIMVTYRHPNQTSDEFDLFLDRLQLTVDRIKNRKPHCIVITGDFNCRSKQWWPEDVELPERSALDELIESNNLSQLIDEPTNIRTAGMSCIDLIITDQANLFVDFGVHPCLDNHCQHQIVHGKLNISVLTPPLYKRKIWYYANAQKDKIKSALENIDWPTIFAGVDVDDMTQLFTCKCINILSQYIPNKIIMCDDGDPPWITAALKSTIKRKHRVYSKCVKRGRKPDDWEYVHTVRNETSSRITKAKDDYFSNLGKSLSDPTNGTKSYWATLKKIINKKNSQIFPRHLKTESLLLTFK